MAGDGSGRAWHYAVAEHYANLATDEYAPLSPTYYMKLGTLHALLATAEESVASEASLITPTLVSDSSD